jgi:hypothetical protein
MSEKRLGQDDEVRTERGFSFNAHRDVVKRLISKAEAHDADRSTGQAHLQPFLSSPWQISFQREAR